MSEGKEREMRLKAMVVGGIIDNKPEGSYQYRGSRGATITPADQDLKNPDVLAFKIKSFSDALGMKISSDFQGEPAILFKSLDELLTDSAAKAQLQARGLIKDKKSWQDGTVAVMMQYPCEKIDVDREGLMGGLVLMTAENAVKLQQEIDDDPRVYFELIRAVNGGPVIKYDGLPVVPRLTEGTRIQIILSKSSRQSNGGFPQNYVAFPMV